MAKREPRNFFEGLVGGLADSLSNPLAIGLMIVGGVAAYLGGVFNFASYADNIKDVGNITKFFSAPGAIVGTVGLVTALAVPVSSALSGAIDGMSAPSRSEGRESSRGKGVAQSAALGQVAEQSTALGYQQGFGEGAQYGAQQVVGQLQAAAMQQMQAQAAMEQHQPEKKFTDTCCSNKKHGHESHAAAVLASKAEAAQAVGGPAV